MKWILKKTSFQNSKLAFKFYKVVANCFTRICHKAKFSVLHQEIAWRWQFWLEIYKSATTNFWIFCINLLFVGVILPEVETIKVACSNALKPQKYPTDTEGRICKDCVFKRFSFNIYHLNRKDTQLMLLRKYEFSTALKMKPDIMVSLNAVNVGRL